MIIPLQILIVQFFVKWFRRHDLDVVPLLKWRTGRPLSPGWYWIRAPHISPRVEKYYDDGRSVRGNDYYVSWLHGEPFQFAGPIQEPDAK